MKKELVSENEKLLKKWDYEKNRIDPTSVNCKSNKKVWWKCECGYYWMNKICDQYKRKNPCKKCGKFLNSLAYKCPSLLKEWDYEKNTLLGFDPTLLSSCSNKKVWWKCELKHSWDATIYSRFYGRGCPRCAGQLPLEENNVSKIDWLVKEWSPKNKMRPDQVSLGSDKRILWNCKKEHEWEARVPDRLKKNSGCPTCAGQRADVDNNLALLYPNLIKEWNEENLNPADFLPQSNKIVKWKCLTHEHIWPAPISDRVRRHTGCPFCGWRISGPSQKWLDNMNIPMENREYRIKLLNGRTITVDGFDEKTNTVLEFYGDYWHGNPRKHRRNKLNKRAGITHGELYDRTMERECQLREAGYNVISIWESDFYNETE